MKSLLERFCKRIGMPTEQIKILLYSHSYFPFEIHASFAFWIEQRILRDQFKIQELNRLQKNDERVAVDFLSDLADQLEQQAIDLVDSQPLIAIYRNVSQFVK